MVNAWIWLALLIPVATAAGLALLRGPWARRAGWLALAALALGLGALGAAALLIPDAETQELWHLDRLALPFILNTGVVSLAAFVYALGDLRQAPRSALAYAAMLLYAASMLASVIVADALLFLLAWEMTVLSSSALLLGWGKGQDRPRITLKYFLYSQAGSLLIMAALARLAQLAGSTRLDALAALGTSLSPAAAYGLAGALLLGFMIKLGVWPVHGWLPDAHTAAPMPVSIMLAGANLGLAAYGILRMALPLFPEAAAPLQLTLLLVALGSQVYGAALCFATDDLKRVLAYSSVSQMGYVLFGLATLSARGITGGLTHLVCHGVYKSLLFIGVGLLGHTFGHQQAGRLHGVGRLLPGIALAMAVGAVGLTGWPPSGGFYGEWMILAGGLATPYHWLGYLEIIAPLMTTAYVAYYLIHLGAGQPEEAPQQARLPAAMRLSLYALAGLALLAGLFPSPLVQWATGAAAMAGGGL